MPRPASLLPSFAIEVAGRQRWIDDVARDATVGDLVRALGLKTVGVACDEVAIDGRAVALGGRLAHSGVRHGSRISSVVTPGQPSSGIGGAAVVAFGTWVTGPDAGASTPVAAGDHHIGRSRHAAIRCDDPAMEPHHALMRVDPDGRMTLHQLAGQRALAVDGHPMDAPVAVTAGMRIEIGGSVLRLDPPDPSERESDVAARPIDQSDPWRLAHPRLPRPMMPFTPESIEAPRHVAQSHGMAGTLWPTLLGVGGAAVLALLFGQVMFLLFGLMGAVAAIGTWLAQRVGLVRSRKRAAAASADAADAFRNALNHQRSAALRSMAAHVPTISGAVSMMCRDQRSLWGVRANDADAFVVSVGEGEGYWQPEVTRTADAPPETWAQIEAASHLGIVPTAASLANGCVLALVGGEVGDRSAVARAMLLQAAAASGPADWRLAMVADDESAWSELDWLAHLCDDNGALRRADRSSVDALVAGLDTGAGRSDAGLGAQDERHIILVLDRPEHLRTRTGAVRRLIARAPSIACIVLCPTEVDVPAMCTSMLVLGRRGTARWIADTTTNALAEPVRLAGIAAEHAREVVRSIAHLTDPEHVADGAGIPAHVGLAELLSDEVGVDPERMPHRLADLWTRRGPDPSPSSPIGIAADGVVEIDLERDGPHGLLAGTTGAGKSELLRSLVLGLAARSRPEHMSFVLVDYKGGATFDGLAGLPHVVGMVTDLDDRLAARALRSLEAELRRREGLLREAGVSDLTDHRRAVEAGRATEDLARLVVVIDEFAGLAVQQPEFLGALLGVAQRGRSLGVHLVLATQRPAGVVSDDIRANTQLRIALRVHDAADAVDVIGEPGAARLPRGLPGRAIVRLGTDDSVVFQTARCSGPLGDRQHDVPLAVRDLVRLESADGGPPQLTEMEVLVRAIRRAAELTGSAAPHRPWLPPLGSQEEQPGDWSTTGMHDVVGVIDDPDQQRRLPLRVPTTGHLAIAGSVGSGTTTALVAVASCCASAGAEVHVLDGMGDPRLSQLADRTGLVQLHERERVARLLDHVCSVISRRSAGRPDEGDGAGHDVVLCIDGLGAVRAAFERDDDWSRLEQLDQIISSGVSCGVRVMLTVARAGAIPAAALSQIAHRWVFHLDEPLEGSALGVPPRSMPAAIPGRLAVAATGLEAQLFATPVQPADARRRHVAPRPIAALPTAVSLEDLPVAVVSGGDVLAPIGIDFETLGPAILPMTAGEHVLIVGPQRSGRSTALQTIAACWLRAVPDGVLACVAPRRSSVRIGEVFGRVDALLDALAAREERTGSSSRTMIVIDDAELVDDPCGRLAALIAGRPEHIVIVAAGRPEALRAGFGHWSAGVRRSRLGVLMAGCVDIDADLLGAVLPRRAPLAARPGLGWVVAEGGRRLIQIAQDAGDSVSALIAANASSFSLDAVGVLP